MEYKKPLKDKKITIYARSVETDKISRQVSCYKPIHPGTLWAYVRQLSGKDLFMASSFHAEEEILFSVNWRAALAMANCLDLFITYRGVWHDVTRVDTYEGYKSDIRLYAKTMRAPDSGAVKPYEQ